MSKIVKLQLSSLYGTVRKDAKPKDVFEGVEPCNVRLIVPGNWPPERIAAARKVACGTATDEDHATFLGKKLL